MHLLTTVSLALSLLFLFIANFVRRSIRTRVLLDQFPTVEFDGSQDRDKYLHNQRQLLRSGYRQHTKYGRVFKERNAMGDWRLVLPKQYLMAIKLASGRKTLSWQQNMREVMMLKYTGGPDRAAWSARVLRVEFTKKLDVLQSEMDAGIADHLENHFVPSDGQWHTHQIYTFFVECIARITNGIFAGHELGHDPEWIATTVGFTETAWDASRDVKKQPWYLTWLSTLYLPSIHKVKQDRRYAQRKLRPIFKKRVAGMRSQVDKKPSDGFQWLLDAAGVDVPFEVFVDTFMRIMMASIHITANQISLALANLLFRPQYIPEIMRELEWSRDPGNDITKCLRLNSFIKESMRFSPSGLLLAGRKTTVPHVFHDGTVIPAGIVVWAPAEAIHFDPEVYDDPERFNGNRFFNLRADGKSDEKKYQLPTATEEYLNFGYGSQACPGRYFAEREMHLIFRKLLLEWDLEWDESSGQAEPSPNYMDISHLPETRYYMKARSKKGAI